MKRTAYVKVCPNCGSINVKSVVTPFMIQVDVCQKCGFEGNFPETEEGKIADFRKKITK